MRQKLLNSLKLRATMLVAMFFVLFTGQAWATVYNMTIDSSNNGTNNVHWTELSTSLTYNDVTWSASAEGDQQLAIIASTTYVQIGSKSKPSTQVTISTTAFAGKRITAASLTGFCMSNEGPTLTIQAGNTAILSGAALVKTTSTTYSANTALLPVTLGANDALTFTINSSAKAAICISQISVTYEDASLRPNDLTLNATEKEFDLAHGLHQTFQLTNSGSANGTLSFESSNEEVATVSSTGLITIVEEGTAVITVTQAASSTYNEGTATCTVTVKDTRYEVSNLTFTDAYGEGPGTADDGAEWTVTSDAQESEFDNTSGIHYGTNQKTVQYLQLTTSGIDGDIKKVVVNARDAHSAAITVTVGGTSFKCAGESSATATTTSRDYTFTGEGIGTIVVRIDRGEAMKKAMYVKSVKVSYIHSAEINAEDSVELACDATSGSIAYTIEYFEEGTMTASTDANWIRNLTCSQTEDNGQVNFTTTANTSTSSRSAVVTLTYSYGRNQTATKEVSVTQAGEVYAPESITLNASGYATFASTSAVDFTDAECTAWAITDVNDTEITFSQITTISPVVAAKTGMFLKGTSNAVFSPAYTTGGIGAADNLLEGVTVAKTIAAGQYYGLKGAEFVKVNAGTVPAGKALLPARVVNGSAVKALTFVFNGADGIKTVEHVSAEEAAEIFNLAGQRVNKAQKGIFILNGKKFIVK